MSHNGRTRAGVGEVAFPDASTLSPFGRSDLAAASWLLVTPGGAIILFILGLNLLGDGLRDLFDHPKLFWRPYPSRARLIP